MIEMHHNLEISANALLKIQSGQFHTYSIKAPEKIDNDENGKNDRN